MREPVKQVFWPGARAPFGDRSAPVEVRSGLVRHRLEVQSNEVELVREAFSLDIGSNAVPAAAERASTSTSAGTWAEIETAPRISPRGRRSLSSGHRLVTGDLLLHIGLDLPTTLRARFRDTTT
jgi:hypothetical protein